jgi:hypothetical protein
MLVHQGTGTPPVLALRWFLSVRRRGFSADYLAAQLRSVGRLYEGAETVLGIALDEFVLAERHFAPDDLTKLVKWIERGCRNEVASGITRGPTGARITPSLPARSFNRITRSWYRFLLWTLVPTHYRPARAHESTPAVIDVRRKQSEVLNQFFNEGDGKPWPEPRSGRVNPLTDLELEAIQAVTAPDQFGRFPESGFAEHTRLRNWLMIQTCRWAGYRLGEMLKTCVTDVPPPPSGEEGTTSLVRDFYSVRALPAWFRTAQREDPASAYSVLNLERRPDDPSDTRLGRKPKVKTAERRPVVPDEYLRKVREYIVTPVPGGRRARKASTPYLFVVLGVGGVCRPISVRNSMRVLKRIGREAAAWMATNHPGVDHTLNSLHWHRFRHTRAMELLPEFLEDENVGLDQFCQFFGWASIVSAEPYVKQLLQRRANAKVRRALKRIDEERAIRRARI